MLRVTTTVWNRSYVILKVEGTVTTEAVAELESECRRWLAPGTAVELDFRDVLHVDGHSTRVLHELAAAGARIVNCPRLVRDLLELSRP